MRSIRSLRLMHAALFSFGTLCGVLCLRRIPADIRGVMISRFFSLLGKRPAVVAFACVLVWPSMMTLLGCSVFGDVFVLVLIVACGFSAGSAAYTCLTLHESLSLCLAALIPFSCCIVSYSADQRMIAADLRQRFRSCSGERLFNRYTLLRMTISVLILLVEAICLLQVVLSVC